MSERGSGKINPVDAYVGSQIKLRRTVLGMSQDHLGGELGVSFQQVQKYENGSNRVAASRMYDVARILDVPVGFFFDGYGRTTTGESTPIHHGALALMRHYQDMLPDQRSRITRIACDIVGLR